MSKVGVVTD